WFFSIAAGLAVLLGSYAARDSNLQRLRGVVAGMAAGSDAGSVNTTANVVFWGSIGALLLLTLGEAVVLAALTGRRSWARWSLLGLLAIHAAVMVPAAAFLVPAGAPGSYVVMLWGAELFLAAAGQAVVFLPSAGAWLRRDSS
ncbi:MAG: hypothetical protein ACLGH7_13320, partial [Actinomycetes bacterium]